MADALKEQSQTTIGEQQFHALCAAGWSQAEVTVQQLGVRRVSAANLVLSEIVNRLYGHFAIKPDRLDRRHDMLRIHEVMGGRMQPPFDYEIIVNRYMKGAEQQYGSEAPAQKLRRSSPRKNLTGGRGKGDFLRKRI